jgi:DNA repair exonuclease SbcCD nuclease subunit
MKLQKTLENESILKIIEATVPNIKVIDRQIEQFTLDNHGISILGISHNALSDFEKTNIVPDEKYKYNILAIHGSYESIKCPELDTYGQTCLINEENINQSKWNYVALGHYHKYTKLGDNTYYSGAIERTSSNVWQEANDPKGFIEYNLETGQQRFYMLKTPRKVIDIKRINANNLTAEEINVLIEAEMNKIKNLEETIVRLTIENIDALTIKNLDYKKIGAYRKNALHFRLNLIKKDYSSALTNENGVIKETKNLYEQVEEELNTFELAAGLNKERFRDLAKSYLYE